MVDKRIDKDNQSDQAGGDKRGDAAGEASRAKRLEVEGSGGRHSKP